MPVTTRLHCGEHDASPAPREHQSIDFAREYAKIRSSEMRGFVEILGPNGKTIERYREGQLEGLAGKDPLNANQVPSRPLFARPLSGGKVGDGEDVRDGAKQQG